MVWGEGERRASCAALVKSSHSLLYIPGKEPIANCGRAAAGGCQQAGGGAEEAPGTCARGLGRGACLLPRHDSAGEVDGARAVRRQRHEALF